MDRPLRPQPGPDRVAKGIADSLWAVHQRAKQYQADFGATYGGVTLSIDADNVDAPVATTAFSYQATALVRWGSGPGSVLPADQDLLRRRQRCRGLPGAGPSQVGPTTVWDKLNNGSYVPDYYVSTPSKTGFSPPVTRCLYPVSKMHLVGGANERSGPGVSYPVTGMLPGGALAWLFCQKSGSAVGGTRGLGQDRLPAVGLRSLGGHTGQARLLASQRPPADVPWHLRSSVWPA